jgi:hypothetical protein
MPTQSHNITTSGIALRFTSYQETWVVDRGILVESTGTEAVFSDQVLSSLINNGTITSTAYIAFAVDMSIDYEFVQNNHLGVIRGYNGVELFSDSYGYTDLYNYGSVVATGSLGVLCVGPNTYLLNKGVVYGHLFGVDLQENAPLDNYDKITSPRIGIEVDGGTTNIRNFYGGQIHGGEHGIYIRDGANVDIDNRGAIVGGVYCTADTRVTIVNGGPIKGLIIFGSADDVYRSVYNGAPGTPAVGTAGAVFGRGGDDRLIGGVFADRLHGGDGNDRLTGGGGADKFYFDTGLNAISNVDTITDFNPGQGDQIVLSEAIFAGIGPTGAALQAVHFLPHSHAATPAQHILYDAATGFLFYDRDGSGSAFAPVHFATLSTHPSLTAGDFFVIA